MQCGSFLGLRQICQHNLKHNRWAYYASIMARIRSILSNRTISVYKIHLYSVICDCLSENPPSSHLLVFREIPF